jgi:hypothetical protein
MFEENDKFGQPKTSEGFDGYVRWSRYMPWIFALGILGGFGSQLIDSKSKSM